MRVPGLRYFATDSTHNSRERPDRSHRDFPWFFCDCWHAAVVGGRRKDPFRYAHGVARPRSEEAHRAAISATVEVLLESGVEGVTLEEVAARSGVAKSTLYRHFGSKEALVAVAARGCV